MSALVLATQRTAQPQGAAPIDWGNPLSRGLVLDAGAHSALRDLVSNRPPSWTAGTPEYAVNKYGRALNFASDVASFGDVELFPSTTATWLIVDKPVNLTQAAGLVNKRLSASSQHAYSIGYNYNSSSELCVDLGGVGGSSVAISYRFALTKFSTNGNIIVVVIDVAAGAGQKVRLYVNGVEETSRVVGADNALSSITNTTAPVELGRVNNGTIYYTGHINRVAAWSRALSPQEAASVSANQWQLFKPVERRIWVPASTGGGDVSVTFNRTDAADTLAASALLEVKTSANLTDQADSLSATAEVPVSGVAVTFNVTDQNDTSSASAAVRISAGASITDSADIASASASALIAASLTQTDAADNLSAAAEILAAGGVIVEANLTDAADTLDATAKAERLEERPSGSGARNWAKFDTPFRRVYAQAAITDDDDRATAWAEVSQPIIVLEPEPEPEPVHQAVATVADDDDAVFCMALVRWPSPQLVRSAALMTTARAAA